MITIESFSFKYEDAEKNALSDLNLHIGRGEFVGIIGPSGAGKTTLTSSLNGVIPHYYRGDFYGKVTIAGIDTVESSCAALAMHVGSVLQDPEAQIVTPVVEEELAFGLENFNLPSEEIKRRITESLEMTGISHLRHRDTIGLSGGQKQKVSIAAAIALRPSILVLDEPTSELDPEGTIQVFDTLRLLNRTYGITIVVVEQKVMTLSAYCSRMMVMHAGRVVLDGPTRDIISQDEKLLGLGINCPRIVSLTSLLKKNGLYDGPYPVNLDEAEGMVRSVIKGGVH